MSFPGFRSVPPINTLAVNGAPGLIRDRHNSDGTPYSTVELYNAVGSTLVAGRPYVVSFDGDEERMITATTPTTGTTTTQWVVVATEDVAASSFGEFAWWGVTNSYLLGSGIAKDDYLEVLPNTTATAFSEDGTGISNNSVAIACESGEATPALKRIVLLGRPVVVASS